MLETNKIHQGDCLELMKDISDKSIDMILCDLPYGTTACKWDTIIPFDKLWEQYKRIITDNGAIVLTGDSMFTSKLMQSNVKYWRYNLIWSKSSKTGFLNSKRMPLRSHEDLLVFYKKLPVYNPIMTNGKMITKSTKTKQTPNYGELVNNRPEPYKSDLYYPHSIINIPNKREKNGHPTQKPVALFEYLIKTYTNENMLVLDNCIGSGTTAVACINTGRNFIGIEKEEKYVTIANERIKNTTHNKQMLEKQNLKNWGL